MTAKYLKDNKLIVGWRIELDSFDCPFLQFHKEESLCFNWNTKTRQCNENDCPIKIKP